MNPAAGSRLYCAFCFERSVADGRCERGDCGKLAYDFRAHSALPPGLPLKGTYRVGHVLGAGGFGITYKVKHLELNKFFAIKELFPSSGDRALVARDESDGTTVRATSATAARHFESMRRGFLAEAKVLVDIDGEVNPEIVKVYDFFEANGTAYIVMPYLKGCTLAELVNREGVLDEPGALRVLRMMLRALRVVHRAGILHQDVKPENVYLVDGGTPVLIDFGNARSADLGPGDARPQAGTPGFAPPEQRSGSMSASGDIYALGATMYAVLTGKEPPAAEDRLAGTALNPPVESLTRHVSPLLVQFIDKALQLNPERRFANVDEVFALLKPLLEPRFDWVALLPGAALLRHMQLAQRKLEGGQAYALTWNWRPALLSYFWFLALRAIPLGLGLAALETVCVVGAFFADELWWVWLLPALASRAAQGFLGDWLVFRDLERHVKQLRAGPKPMSPDGVHRALRARLRLQPAMVMLGLACGPVLQCVALFLSQEHQEVVRDKVKASIQVNRLMCKMQQHVAENRAAPTKDQLGLSLEEAGGSISAYQLDDAHLMLTLKSPSEAAGYKVRLEFDPVSGQYVRCMNFSLPSSLVPEICGQGQVKLPDKPLARCN